MRRAIAALALAVVVALAGRARAGDGVALLKYMPEDTDLYMVLDVAAAKRTPVFEGTVSALLAAMPAKESDEGTKVFGGATIDTIVFGFALPDNKAFVAVGELDDADAVVDRDRKVNAKLHSTQYHGVTYWISGRAAFTAVDRHHLVFASVDHIEAAIDVAIGKRPSAAKSPAAARLRDAVAATDTRHDVWTTLVPWDAVAKPLHDQAMDVTSVSLAAGISDQVIVDGTIVTASEASARKLFVAVDKDKGRVVPGLQKLGLADAAKSYDASLDGASIHVTFTLDKDELAALIARMHR